MDKTLSSMVFNRVEKYSDYPVLRFKKDGSWHDISWSEFGEKIESLANGLLSLGIQPEDKVAILSENRPEWAITDIGIISVRGVVVPIYHTNKAHQIEFVLEHSESKILIVSKEEMLAEVLEIRENLKQLEHIFLIDREGSIEIPDEIKDFDELLELGRKYQKEQPNLLKERIENSHEDEIISFVYTSGTTGNPKGVMLSHKNFLENVKAATEVVEVDAHEVALSFLPLSHVLERMAGYYLILYKVGIIAYAEGVNEVADNMPEVKPNVMVSVPRLYEKIYAGILNNINQSSNFKKKLFFWSLGVGKEWFYTNLDGKTPSLLLKIKHSIADKLVFSKLKALTGGQLRFFISGGAALAKDINEFFHAIGLTILEGYGLTETAPVLSVNSFEKLRLGSVGPAIPNVELKIAEDGEILAKGPNISIGYYKQPEETAEVFKDGWFCTGDIGYIDEDGFLFITDRKKDIIVTSGGKNVAPQNIEGLLGTDPYISQAVVFGDKEKYLAALVIPDFPALAEYAKETGIDFKNNQDLVSDPKVVDFYNERIKELIKDLPSYEQIKKFALLSEEFSTDTGELTPTLKVRRKFVQEKYGEIIDSLFVDDLEFDPNAKMSSSEKPA